jgi:hypothetical protein
MHTADLSKGTKFHFPYAGFVRAFRVILGWAFLFLLNVLPIIWVHFWHEKL